MKMNVKAILIGTLVGVSVLSVHAYNIWAPIQFVKQLFVTPNGELDSSKATIKIDGTKGSIEARSVKVNGEDVATLKDLDQKIPKCPDNYVLTSSDGHNLKCVKSVGFKLDGKCSNYGDVCTQGVFYDLKDDSNYYYRMCLGLNGGKTVKCKYHKEINGVCGNNNRYICKSGVLTDKGTDGEYYTWTCAGQYHGSSDFCKYHKEVNGKCGSSAYSCDSGNSTAHRETTTTWTWTCEGKYNGVSASCVKKKPYVTTCNANTLGMPNKDGKICKTRTTTHRHPGTKHPYKVQSCGYHRRQVHTANGRKRYHTTKCERILHRGRSGGRSRTTRHYGFR